MSGFYPNLESGAGQPGLGTQVNASMLTGASGQVVSSLSSATYAACFWIITAIDGSNFSSQKIIHATVNGTSMRHIESRNGKNVKFDVDVQLNVGQIELLLDNNHGSDIDIRILQFATER